MKKITFKRGSVYGTALRSVTSIALCGSLIFGGYSYMEQGKELDKAKKDIVQHETSLKNQETIISSLEKDKMDLTSKNDKLLKDNAKLNQKLKSEGETISQLQQKLKQTELQAKK
jgi:septal ring factor EnvC (AmiA/AmiB activator)